ncbi:unnamed protein product [Symbiodinium natans]|uniref:C3H1-type domain-containing protein n=1 Tax=Symbiodinium natans TaxID=878477 RepID=A0A812PST0_9DINO|nr:unnamed protein product [Symbiodinium natans]
MFLQLGSMSESRSPETTSSLPMGPPHGPMKTSQDNVELCRRHQLCLGEQTHLEALNKGSFGHPELCRKPCQFFHLGTCAMGRSCGYCHMPHTGSPATLDRVGRVTLRKLPAGRTLELFLPILYARAEESDLMMEAAPLLAMLAQAEAQSEATSHPAAKKSSDRDPFKEIRKTLRKMTFSELVGLLCRNCDKEAFVPQVTEELMSLRENCADRVLI